MTSNIKVSKEEIRSFKELDLISKIRLLQDRIALFESKYSANFEVFEISVKESDEDFEKWDDYIEWKAYNKECANLQHELQEVKNAENFEITD